MTLIFPQDKPYSDRFPVGGNYDSETPLCMFFSGADVTPCGPQETETAQLPVNHDGSICIFVARTLAQGFPQIKSTVTARGKNTTLKIIQFHSLSDDQNQLEVRRLNSLRAVSPF